jgi:hypothetical protein
LWRIVEEGEDWNEEWDRPGLNWIIEWAGLGGQQQYDSWMKGVGSVYDRGWGGGREVGVKIEST